MEISKYSQTLILGKSKPMFKTGDEDDQFYCCDNKLFRENAFSVLFL